MQLNCGSLTGLSRRWLWRIGPARSRYDVVCALLGLVLMAAFGCINTRDAVPKSEAAPAITVPEEDRDFGSVWASEGFCRELRLDNHGSEAVTIAELKTSCRCVTVEPESLTIPAGQSGEVQLTMDLSKSFGDFNTRLIAVVRGREPTVMSWLVQGYVRRAITASSPEVFFNTELTRGQPGPPKSTEITALVPLESLDVDCDPAFAIAKVSHEAGSIYTLSIHPNETLPPGPFEYSVILVPKLLSGERPPPARVKVSGTVWEEVEALPSPLNLADGPVGSILKGSIVLRSRVMKPFRVESILPVSTDTVVSLEDPTEQAALVGVQQTVLAGGHHQTSVKLVVRSGDGKPFELDLPVIYYGLTGGS